MDHSRRQSGFTLVELMLAIAVASVLLAVAVPSFQGFMDRTQLQHATREIVNVIKAARERAVANGETVTVLHGGNSVTCDYVGETLQNPCETYSLTDGDLALSGGGANNQFNIEATGMLSDSSGFSFSVTHQAVLSHRFDITLYRSGRISVTEVDI